MMMTDSKCFRFYLSLTLLVCSLFACSNDEKGSGGDADAETGAGGDAETGVGADAETGAEADSGVDGEIVDNDSGEAGTEVAPVRYTIEGYAQKGPFINGTSVVLRELGSSLDQTGRSFSTAIEDDTGNFILSDIDLASDFVEVSADGFYFDEVAGDLSSARIELRAIADVGATSTINVNILTHIEAVRVKYLVKNAGISFEEAKKQALQEILDIFKIDNPDMANAETLDMSLDGADNAILIAISSIFQGIHTTAELVELLSAVATDLRQDGILDSESSRSSLIDEAAVLDLTAIRSNLEDRYEKMGIDASIADFESVVESFVDRTDFVFTRNIIYPDSTASGAPNALDMAKTSYVLSTVLGVGDANQGSLGVAAELPPGTSLVVHFVSEKNNRCASAINAELVSEDPYIDRMEFEGPDEVEAYLMVLDGPTNMGAGVPIFDWPCQTPALKIEIYENRAQTPTRTKDITWTVRD